MPERTSRLKPARGPTAAGPSSRRNAPDWREPMLAQLRRCIERAVPEAVEERKWKKPSNPEGVPVWSQDGILCIANVLKRAVRLTFPHGADLPDPHRVFNTRLDSRTVRAVDFYEGVRVDERALSALLVHARRWNEQRRRNA